MKEGWVLFRRAWAGLLALLLAAVPGVAAAEIGADDYEAAARLLNRYGLVQGDARGYRFGDPITRAEMAKVLVHAVGLESQASQYLGRRDFSDTTDHWAEGLIALSREVGFMRGYPAGDFRPNLSVSYAEALTVLSRLVGLEPSDVAWPQTYLAPAQKAGIIPASMSLEGRLNQPAIRGDLFVLLKRTLVDVTNYAGQNLLRRYLDQTPPELTLDPVAAESHSGRIIITGSISDAAELRVNGKGISFDLGAFRAEVDLQLGPNTIRVQAIDHAGNVAVQTAQVTRLEGRIVRLSLSGPATVVAGSTGHLTVGAYDQNGASVDLPLDLIAKVSPEAGRFDPFTGLFLATGKAESVTVTVGAGGLGTSKVITILPGPLQQIAISPAEIALGPGEMALFTLTGSDAHGNEVPVAGQVHWSANGGTVNQSGRYSAPSSGSLAGSYSITAIVGGRSATALVHPPGSRVVSIELMETQGKALLANGNSQITLRATLLDTAGERVRGYQGTLSISSSAVGVAAPTAESVAVVDGAADVVIRAGLTPGAATMTATTAAGISGKVTLSVEPQKLQSVRLEGRPVPSGPDGVPLAVIEAVALDQEGRPLRSALTQTMILGLTLPSGADASFVSNDKEQADIALGPLDGATGEVRSRTHIRYSRGAGTLVVMGQAKPASMSWVQVLPGVVRADQLGTPTTLRIEPIADITAGGVRSIYINAMDADGYRVTQPSMLTGFVVSLCDQTGALWPAAVNLADGQGRARFDVAQTRSGSYTYTATLQPGGSSTGAVSQVVPGALAQIGVSATPDFLQADNVSQSTLRAELLDAYGNRVTAPGYAVTFTRLSATGATQPFPSQTVQSAQGVAEVKVTAARVIAPEQFQAAVSAPGAALSATVTVTTRGAPERLRIRYGDNDGDGVADGPSDHRGVAGSTLTIIADVLDQMGNVAGFQSGRTVSLTIRQGLVEATPLTGTTSGGEARFYVSRQQAGTYAVKAESAGLVRALSNGYGGSHEDAVFLAGATQSLTVSADLSTLHPDDGVSYSRLTVHLSDGAGNPTPNQTGAPITVMLDTQRANYSYGFFTIDGLRTGVRTQTLTVVIPPGAAASAPVKLFSGTLAGNLMVKGTLPDGVSASTTVGIKSLGSVAQLQVASVKASTVQSWAYADSAVSGQEVVVTAVDSVGNRVSQYTGPLSVAASDPDVRVVAYLHPVTRTWVSLDTAPGNGLGDYPTTAWIAADRGQARFRVRSSSPGTRAYTVGDTQNPSLSSRKQIVFGWFDGLWPAALSVSVERGRVTGGGDQVAIVARVVDQAGSAQPWVTGPIRFRLLDDMGGRLLSGTVDLRDGLATAWFESRLDLSFADVPVTVEVWSEHLRTEGGALLPPVLVNLVVDGTAPTLQGIELVPGAGPGSGLVTPGDLLRFTFSEPMQPGSVMGGDSAILRLDEVGQGIEAVGLSWLEQVGLGAISGTAGYLIESVSLDASGMVVTLQVGARVEGAADVQVTPPATATVQFSVAAPPRDQAGNGVGAPGAVPVSGGW